MSVFIGSSGIPTYRALVQRSAVSTALLDTVGIAHTPTTLTVSVSHPTGMITAGISIDVHSSSNAYLLVGLDFFHMLLQSGVPQSVFEVLPMNPFPLSSAMHPRSSPRLLPPVEASTTALPNAIRANGQTHPPIASRANRQDIIPGEGHALPRSNQLPQSQIGHIEVPSAFRRSPVEQLDGFEYLRRSITSNRTAGVSANPLLCLLSTLVDILGLHGLDARGLTLSETQSMFFFHILSGDCADERLARGDRTACILYRKGFDSPEDMSRHAFQILKSRTTGTIMTILKMLNISTSFSRRHVREQCLRLLDDLGSSFVPSFSTLPNGAFLKNFDRAPKPQLLAIAHSHYIPVDRYTSSRADLQQQILGHFISGECYSHASSVKSKGCVVSMEEHLNSSSTNRGVNSAHSCCLQWLTAHVYDFSLSVLRRVFSLLNLEELPHNDLNGWRSSLRQYLRAQSSSPVRSQNPNLTAQSAAIQNLWPTTPSQTTKEKLIAEFRNATSTDVMRHVVCGSCAEFVLKSGTTVVAHDNIDLRCFLRPDRRPSYWDHETSSDFVADATWIRHDYDFPDYDPPIPELPDVLLDGRGVSYDEVDDNYRITLCESCVVAAKQSRVPSLSLANHNFLGRVPAELADLTTVEEALIARCRVQKIIVHLKEDPAKKPTTSSPERNGPAAQRHYKGHTILFPQKTTKLLNMLPPSVDEITESICLLFVGAGKPSKEWMEKEAKPLFVRRHKVEKALLWLKAHNPLYFDVAISGERLDALPEASALPVHFEHVVPTDASESLTARYDSCDDEGNYFENGPRVSDRECNDYQAPFPSVVIADVNPDATAADMKRAAARHFQKKGRHLLVGHDIKPATEFFNPDLFPCIYPSIFPYGLGGFEIPHRSSKLSLQFQGRHLLHLADKRFQRHPAFMFTLFNLIQRRQLLLHTSLKVKRANYDRIASAFASLSPSTVHSVAEQVAKGKPRANFSREEQQTFDLLREVNVVTSHVPGSSAARVALRNEIRAMMIEKGLPTFYITINPADTRNPLVRLLAGEDIDLDNLAGSLPFTELDQAVLIANHPAVGANFFDHYMQAFIRTLLNYLPDTLQQSPGVLGTVKSYYGCVEAQGRGSLHCHMLVWLDGALNIDEIKQKMAYDDSNAFGDALLAYLNDCISTGRPARSDSYVEPNVHPATSRPPPDTLAANTQMSPQAQDDLFDCVNRMQMHRHNKGCYKYCKPGENKVCRFELDDKNTSPPSYIDAATGDIHLEKLEGMVNNFNDTILRAIRSNMDIKFIGSGPSAKAVLYYITDYITKSQLETHVAYAALDAAIKKLGEYNPNEEHIVDRAKKLLRRCAYMMIKHQELSAQQVACYIMGNPDHYKSHDATVLYWTSFEAYIDSQLPSPECYKSQSSRASSDIEQAADNATPTDDIEAHSDSNDTSEENAIGEDDVIQHESYGDEDTALEPPNDDKLISKADRIKDYVLRSDALSRICLWDFVAQFQKSKVKAKDADTENPIIDTEVGLTSVALRNQPVYGFMQEHPDCNSHSVKLRSSIQRRHPNPLGPPLPRRDIADQKLRHARLMLIFFKPWRDVSDLIGSHSNWMEAFDDFRLTICSRRLHTFIDNMQLLHECKDSRDDHFLERQRNRRRNAASSTSVQEDTPTEEAMQNMILQHLESTSNARSVHRSAAQVEADICVDAVSQCGLFNNDDADVNLGDFVPTIQGTNITNCSEDKEGIWRTQYDENNRQWKAQLRANNDVRTDPSSTFEALNTALPNHLSWDNGSNVELDSHLAISDEIPPPSSKPPSSIDGITEEFTLNSEQQKAFRIVASHSSNNGADQLRMFIGGPGGTGKSRVITALKTYFDRNDEGRRFRLASYTGVAAKNIEGMTLHSALNLNQRRNGKMSSRAKEELIAAWRGVDYLFIDEVSMIGCRFLLKISEALSDAKQSNQPFGGINIIFAGDFAQLPPVADRRLFSDINTTNVGSIQGLKIVLGKLLWYSVSTVVLLTEIKRQNSARDQRFIELLDRLRSGACTQSDFQLLRTRLASNPDVAESIHTWQDSPIVVSKNECKDALNVKAVKEFASRTGQEMHWYYSDDTWAAQPIENDELRDSLWTLPSNKCEQRLGRLPLVIGMPVMLSTNYEVQAGVVNGCTGILTDIRYTVDDQGRRHAVSCIVQSSSVTSSLPDLPDHSIAAVKDKVRFSVSHPDTRATCQIERNQVPILPAFSFTAHKSQGQSMDKVMADIESCYGTESPYVMLSRVKSLDGLIILRQFRISKIQCRPSPDVRKEMRRQHLLSLVTTLHHGQDAERQHAATLLSQWKCNTDGLVFTPTLKHEGTQSSCELQGIQHIVDSLPDIQLPNRNKRKFSDCE